MSEFLAKNLLRNMPLVLTNKLFKSPLGLFFKGCGIARAMPVIIDIIEVPIDFYIYVILEFDILIGYPLENLIQEKCSHGGLDEKLGTTASATPITCPECPKAKQQPNHNLFEEVKLIPPFVSPKLAYETKQSSSPSLEPKPCPSGHPNVILNGRDSTLIVHDVSFKKKNFCAMDIVLSTACNYEDLNPRFKTF